MPTRPASNSWRMSSRWWGSDSSSSSPPYWGGPPSGSRCRLACTHVVARRRKLSTSSTSTSVIESSSEPGTSRQPLAVGLGCAVGEPVGGDTSQEEVQVVLPRDPDAPVELDGVLHEVGRLLADVGLRRAHDRVGI